MSGKRLVSIRLECVLKSLQCRGGRTCWNAATTQQRMGKTISTLHRSWTSWNSPNDFTNTFQPFGGRYFSSLEDNNEDRFDNEDTRKEEKQQQETPFHHRVWKSGNETEIWTQRFLDREDEEAIIRQIEAQEISGGRMKAQQLGVLNDDPATDMELLTQNYSATSLASALRDREEALQLASVLAANGEFDKLQKFLEIYHPKLVLDRRLRRRSLELLERLDDHALEWIRKCLMRMPRNVVSAHAKRAGVVLALCTVEGVPCVLLEKRSSHLRAHPDEVCLPGGMVCEISDDTIVATCLREMREEIGGLPDVVNVLGVYRMNWGDLHHLVGVAVTPVVCFLGELPTRLDPNPDEVSQVFTVSLRSLAEPSNWLHKEHLAPIFLGGPFAIWGLTGYILDRFRKDLLRPNRSSHNRSP